MPRALSRDLRDRFEQLMASGMTAAAAGRTLLLSPATATRWGYKIRHGRSLDPRPPGVRPGSGKLEVYLPFFQELIIQDPDITLSELRDALYDACGVRCAVSSIHYILVRHGYTYKKRSTRRGTKPVPRYQGA